MAKRYLNAVIANKDVNCNNISKKTVIWIIYRHKFNLKLKPMINI
jgi:hypothetical protein